MGGVWGVAAPELFYCYIVFGRLNHMNIRVPPPNRNNTTRYWGVGCLFWGFVVVGLVGGGWGCCGCMGTACPHAPPCLGTACPQSPPSMLSGLRGTSGSLASPVSDAVCGLRGPLSHGPYAVRASEPRLLWVVGLSGSGAFDCTLFVVNPSDSRREPSASIIWFGTR